MLKHNSPVEAANYLADYINGNVSAFADNLKAAALDAVREASPVARMARGIEVLFAVLLAEDAPDRETGLNALGSASTQVAEGNFWGKQDRSIEFIKWVRFELGEWPEAFDAPPVPAVDTSLTPTVASPTTEWPVDPATGDGEGGQMAEDPA